MKKFAQQTSIELKLSNLDEKIRSIAFSHGWNGTSFREDIRLASKAFNAKKLNETRAHLQDFNQALKRISELLESNKDLVALRDKLSKSRKLSIEKRAGFFSAFKDLFKKKEQPKPSAPTKEYTFEEEQWENIFYIANGIRDLIIFADDIMFKIENILNDCMLFLNSKKNKEYIKTIFKLVPLANHFEVYWRRADKEFYKPLHDLRTARFGDMPQLVTEQKDLGRKIPLSEEREPLQYTPPRKLMYTDTPSIDIPLGEYSKTEIDAYDHCPCGSGKPFVFCHGTHADAKPSQYKAPGTFGYKEKPEIGFPYSSEHAKIEIAEHDYCPCGSGRAFLTCHGMNDKIVKEMINYMIDKMRISKEHAEMYMKKPNKYPADKALTEVLKKRERAARYRAEKAAIEK